jgi:ABC-type sugar transport system permease subunit
MLTIGRGDSPSARTIHPSEACMKSITKKKLHASSQAYSLLAPNLVLFACFSLFPILWTLKFMFFRYGGIGTTTSFVGLKNFARVFRDTVYWKSVLNTFVYAAGKIVITIPLSFSLAYILNKRIKGSGLFQGLIFLPTIMSSAVMGLIFYLLYNVYNGEINRYLLALGLIDTPLNWLGPDHAMLTLVLVAVWGALGNYMVYFLAGLQQIPKETLESATIDGASSWKQLWYITIPMMGPILKIILMLAIAIAFNDMNSVLVLTEGGPYNATMVMTLYAYKFFFPVSASTSTLPQYGYGAAVGFVSACIAACVTLLYMRFSKKLDEIY